MGQQAMVIESIQAGAKDFIVKPFQANRVIEALQKLE
jgi:two-component system chemotaxis response regulator CheY